MIYDELNTVFDKGGERPLLAFLKENPYVVRQAIYSGWGHEDYVLHEFPFGNKFKADFVVLLSHSGGWEVNFIEVEPVDDDVITKGMKPSSRLNGAFSQLGDWREYTRLNQAHVQRDLADRCMSNDLLKFTKPEGKEPENAGGILLRSPETFVKFHYYIFIGRRERVVGEKRDKMNQFVTDSMSICTVDRFLDAAKRIDARQEELKNHDWDNDPFFLH